MKVIKKTELLKAMCITFNEYKKNEHHSNLDHCELCRLYNRYNKEYLKHECELCPMYVFYEKYKTVYPCMKRKCEPVDCENGGIYGSTKDSNELLAVIDFYKEAISIVKNMTSEELNKKNAFKFLIKIDKVVAKKYCLI